MAIQLLLSTACRSLDCCHHHQCLRLVACRRANGARPQHPAALACAADTAAAQSCHWPRLRVFSCLALGGDARRCDVQPRATALLQRRMAICCALFRQSSEATRIAVHRKPHTVNGYKKKRRVFPALFRLSPSHLLDTDLAAFDGGEELLCLRIVRVGAGVLFQHFDGFVAFVLGE